MRVAVACQLSSTLVRLAPYLGVVAADVAIAEDERTPKSVLCCRSLLAKLLQVMYHIWFCRRRSNHQLHCESVMAKALYLNMQPTNTWASSQLVYSLPNSKLMC